MRYYEGMQDIPSLLQTCIHLSPDNEGPPPPQHNNNVDFMKNRSYVGNSRCGGLGFIIRERYLEGRDAAMPSTNKAECTFIASTLEKRQAPLEHVNALQAHKARQLEDATKESAE